VLIIGQEHRGPMEINVSGLISTVTFSADGQYILSGGRDGVQMWRVEDGQKIATISITTGVVRCLAVSKDGSWIALGVEGSMLVWDAKTYKQVFAHEEEYSYINAVDFSPDSTRLVSPLQNGTALVWDIATRQKAQTLRHEDWVFAAKYSPQGDRIATVNRDSVRVHDSNDGRLLVDIRVAVTLWIKTSLVWFHNFLLFISEGKIKQFEASTGSAVSEWPVPDTDQFSCIALPENGEFIACAAKCTVTFWDTSTHTQLGLIQHSQDICSIAFSPDDLFIAIGGKSGQIIIESLSHHCK